MSDAGAPEAVSLDVEITDGRTVITLSGDRDAAVVVRSEAGERIYLPPEDFERPPEPRRGSPYDSPYQPAAVTDDSPYQPVRGEPATTGLEPTADGFRIIHPEPVIDLRLLR
ncbi:MAG: hypothetical protein ABEI39_00670 [Halobacteriales archaeon]